jgi:hypothetical protein
MLGFLGDNVSGTPLFVQTGYEIVVLLLEGSK